jgi:sulfite reductase (NADPH) hemoprotein beta-component
VDVAKAVLTIHRDFGDRTDRKHARLKYVIAERGADWARSGDRTSAPVYAGSRAAISIYHHRRSAGLAQSRGRKLVPGLFVETGRVKDAGGYKLKTALRHIADAFQKVEFRLSANQNIILANASATRTSIPSTCCCRPTA